MQCAIEGFEAERAQLVALPWSNVIAAPPKKLPKRATTKAKLRRPTVPPYQRLSIITGTGNLRDMVEYLYRLEPG